MSGVVGRTGGQAKTTMHALLNDRIVERSERIMGGAHKSMESGLLPNSRWEVRGKLFIENLSGIENSLGVQHPFEVTQYTDVDFANGAGQKAFLGQSDPVFAADRTAKLNGKQKDLSHRFMNPVDLVRIPFVGEKRRMEIAISKMAEGSNRQFVLLGDLLDKTDHLRELRTGDRRIFEDGRWSYSSHCGNRHSSCRHQFGGFFNIFGQRDRTRTMFPGNLCHSFRLFVHRRGVPIALEQQD